MRKFLFLTIVLMMAFSAQSQNSIPSFDSLNVKELILFSNNGCGKCETSEQYFIDHQIPYTKFAIRENRPLMYEYIYKKTNGQKTGVGYPVIVYGDSIYFSIKNLNATLEEVKKMMTKDGLIAPQNK